MAGWAGVGGISSHWPCLNCQTHGHALSVFLTAQGAGDPVSPCSWLPTNDTEPLPSQLLPTLCCLSWCVARPPSPPASGTNFISSVYTTDTACSDLAKVALAQAFRAYLLSQPGVYGPSIQVTVTCSILTVMTYAGTPAGTATGTGRPLVCNTAAAPTCMQRSLIACPSLHMRRRAFICCAMPQQTALTHVCTLDRPPPVGYRQAPAAAGPCNCGLHCIRLVSVPMQRAPAPSLACAFDRFAHPLLSWQVANTQAG
jgi:hypothetical protein